MTTPLPHHANTQHKDRNMPMMPCQVESIGGNWYLEKNKNSSRLVVGPLVPGPPRLQHNVCLTRIVFLSDTGFKNHSVAAVEGFRFGNESIFEIAH